MHWGISEGGLKRRRWYCCSKCCPSCDCSHSVSSPGKQASSDCAATACGDSLRGWQCCNNCARRAFNEVHRTEPGLGLEHPGVSLASLEALNCSIRATRPGNMQEDGTCTAKHRWPPFRLLHSDSGSLFDVPQQPRHQCGSVQNKQVHFCILWSVVVDMQHVETLCYTIRHETCTLHATRGQGTVVQCFFAPLVAVHSTCSSL